MWGGWLYFRMAFDHNDRRILAELLATLRDILNSLRGAVHELHEIAGELKPLPPVALTFTRAVYSDGAVERNPMAVSMSDTQSVVLALGTNDAKGNPTPLPTFDSPPVYVSSNPAIVTVTPAADGLTAVAAAVGPVGSSTVSVTGSVGGVALAAAAIDVTITGVGPAVALTLTAGTPTP
jgi:hypothetical protein